MFVGRGLFMGGAKGDVPPPLDFEKREREKGREKGKGREKR